MSDKSDSNPGGGLSVGPVWTGKMMRRGGTVPEWAGGRNMVSKEAGGTESDGTKSGRDGTGSGRDGTESGRDGTESGRVGTESERDGTESGRDGTGPETTGERRERGETGERRDVGTEREPGEREPDGRDERRGDRERERERVEDVRGDLGRTTMSLPCTRGTSSPFSRARP